MCCMPDPRQRPDFQAIAERFSQIIPEDQDPRPVARIKNKRVITKAVGGGFGDNALAAPGFMHNTYRNKFRGMGTNAPQANQSPRSPSAPSSTVPPDNFLDTFAQTLLKTFTPAP